MIDGKDIENKDNDICSYNKQTIVCHDEHTIVWVRGKEQIDETDIVSIRTLIEAKDCVREKISAHVLPSLFGFINLFYETIRLAFFTAQECDKRIE